MKSTKEILAKEMKTSHKRAESPLDQYAKNVHSQTGEDGVVQEMVNRIDPVKFYVEFGAWDGVHLSNTANLRENFQWNGILFEEDKDKMPNNAPQLNLHCENITPYNINYIFEKYNIPHDFGLLSIDIDSYDSYIWEALQDTYKPDIVIIEFNPGLPNHLHIKVNPSYDTALIEDIAANENIIEVASTAVFPLENHFRIRVGKEWMFVTGNNGNALTVTRGIENTTVSEHYEGDCVSHVVVPARYHSGYWGANLSEMCRIAECKNYEFIMTLGTNVIFVRKEKFPKLQISNINVSLMLDNYCTSSYSQESEHAREIVRRHENNWITEERK